MIDYNQVKDLSEEEIIALAESIAKEQADIANAFNAMTEEERKDNVNMVSQCELLQFKFYSLRDIVWFKQGHLQMKLPDGIDYPDRHVKEKGIKRIIKSKLNRNKKKC